MTQQKLRDAMYGAASLAVRAVMFLSLAGSAEGDPALTKKPKPAYRATTRAVVVQPTKTTPEPKLTVHNFFPWLAALDILGLVLVVCLCSSGRSTEPENTS